IETCIPAEVVAAIDVNTTANDVYKYNFRDTPLWPKTIEGITLEEFDTLAFDMILMSPPCQPFTRIGLQGDVLDPRTKSFLHILDFLPRLLKLPKYILIENVKGFETSSARDVLIKTLERCAYTYQEFLLSPTCLGIPNSRLRYFLIAKLQPEPFCFQTTNQILEKFPNPHCLDTDGSKPIADFQEQPSLTASEAKPKGPSNLTGRGGRQHHGKEKEAVIFKLETAGEVVKKQEQDNDLCVQMLKDFLEEDVQDLSQYLLPPKSLLRYSLVMDIVKPTCRRSTCFTKGYGHYIEGTGSVLQTALEVEVETAFKSFESLSEEEKLRQLSTLKLRYFTPREIANLQGFPSEFKFLEKITRKQCYRLLGNSLNVHVVAKLITLMCG
uniref:tRNA (cytosine(38)-C(5))-methyltransferase n=1 Tax=Latimeria chalumnae TaxID=7897 RepID=H3B1J9_LATCH